MRNGSGSPFPSGLADFAGQDGILSYVASWQIGQDKMASCPTLRVGRIALMDRRFLQLLKPHQDAHHHEQRGGDLAQDHFGYEAGQQLAAEDA